MMGDRVRNPLCVEESRALAFGFGANGVRNPDLTRRSGDATDVTDPAALLVAADEGAVHVRLDLELERLVARALASGELGGRAAPLGLRVYERADRAAGREVRPRLRKLLGDVRAAMRASKGAA